MSGSEASPPLSSASLSQPLTQALAAAASPISVPIAGRIDVPVGEESLSEKQVRDIVRLWQCRVCSLPLLEPVTLPCGRTVCQRCLPETHVRTNISYPLLANRLRGFNCPFSDCGKEHVLGDCGVDVTLKKTLAAVKTEFGNGGATEERPCHDADPQDLETTLPPAGRLLQVWRLADHGKLDFSADVASDDALETAAAECAESGTDCDDGLLARIKDVVRSEMDCQVCYALFCEPFTTPCGHTFCQACLHRVLDHSSYCPVCRRPLSNSPALYGLACPRNDFIVRVTTVFWADELERRKQAVLAEGRLLDNAEFDIPVFVCTLSFPQMPTFLHIFEPRYRLMIRRALEGDRIFGMVAYRRARSGESASFVELGTVLRIINVEFYQDGRSLIETVGVSRFRIIRHGVQDGYMVAKIERINDINTADEEELEARETRDGQGLQTFMEDSGSGATLLTATGPAHSGPAHRPSIPAHLDAMATRELMDFVADFVRRMQEQSVGWLTTRILAIYGECPTDPALLPWWFASVLPLRDLQKYRLLSTTSVRERLKICSEWVIEWQSSRW